MRAGSAKNFRRCAALLAVLVAGCSNSPDRAEHFLVAGGRYVLYDCAQLARTERDLVKREMELARLDARAREGPAGGAIANMTYEPEYRMLRGEVLDIHREQASKNCPSADAATTSTR